MLYHYLYLYLYLDLDLSPTKMAQPKSVVTMAGLLAWVLCWDIRHCNIVELILQNIQLLSLAILVHCIKPCIHLFIYMHVKYDFLGAVHCRQGSVQGY